MYVYEILYYCTCPYHVLYTMTIMKISPLFCNLQSCIYMLCDCSLILMIGHYTIWNETLRNSSYLAQCNPIIVHRLLFKAITIIIIQSSLIQRKLVIKNTRSYSKFLHKIVNKYMCTSWSSTVEV